MKQSRPVLPANPKTQYDFEPDEESVYESKGDVSVMMVLEFDYDPEVARSELEQLTDGIGYVTYFWLSDTLVCRTSPKTCLDVFDWEVVQDSTRVPGEQYTSENYRAVDAPEIPDELDGIVKSLYLNIQHS